MRLIFLLSIFLLDGLSAQDLQRVRHFGKNKGHLKMYMHVPPGIDRSKPAPMVVMLHGCTQCAGSANKQTGWSKLADEQGFYVIYPQQRFWNNPEKCFRWYKRKHTNKNRGENHSILQMVNYMKKNHNIDSSRVFITGLSAGAGMAVIMMADYPQVFNSGAIFAGGAYKSGNGMTSSVLAMLGWRIKTAEKWGRIVRKQNPDYKGSYPRMIIYQGNNDIVVNKRNGVELMKQWTDLHGLNTTPSQTIDGFLGNKDIKRSTYGANEEIVFYQVNHLSHALLVDPGKCKEQGGRRGLFSRDKDYNSTLWTAYDFGLMKVPEIDGHRETLPKQHQQFTVPLNIENSYQWSYPPGCKLVTGDGTNSIVLEWGSESGCVNVTEIDPAGCRKHYKTLFVTLQDPK